MFKKTKALLGNYSLEQAHHALARTHDSLQHYQNTNATAVVTLSSCSWPMCYVTGWLCNVLHCDQRHDQTPHIPTDCSRPVGCCHGDHR